MYISTCTQAHKLHAGTHASTHKHTSTTSPIPEVLQVPVGDQADKFRQNSTNSDLCKHWAHLIQEHTLLLQVVPSPSRNRCSCLKIYDVQHLQRSKELREVICVVPPSVKGTGVEGALAMDEAVAD